ncbi:MAG: methyltransferase domain-containing protein, partial [candidate division Zixibacteria bacterium]|nr:methyltransferase domain-containing protein [candidate division Zixibacteria bacterium]NIR65896.1 methyltransferase domain-containing protein [candidate division Zixibacteria bacterium]NIS47545.1 methyltransferase domain-containing protein [candidate division Zixibacteria bacterium]NIU15188.1 methyltransferase domain-containing protein [candidate division Zixibacteria bacterium]NIV07792.1 methyltransferase domain-containing protein [candidate division Zixibacteria bacterium]
YFYFGHFDSDTLQLSTAVKNMYRHLMNMAGITADTRVLNVGWGIGELELYLHENYGCDIWRVYHDPLRIETAQRRCREKGYEQNIHFQTADSLIGHFPDNHFDVVLAFESSVFFNDKSSFMKDCWRILSNSGRMVFADTMLMKELSLADIFYSYQK